MRTGHSMRWALACVVVGWAAYAAAPPPLWRALTAQEQKEVSALEARFSHHAAAGEFEQAAGVAEEIAAYRARRQGTTHWQAIDARLGAEEWRRLAKVPEKDRPAVHRAWAANSVGVSLVNKGRFREAEKPLREALDIRLKALGELHPSTAASYNNVATCLKSQGKHQEALLLYQKALGVHLKTLGERHPETAISYNNVAACLGSQGRHQEALPLYQKALDVWLKALGELHPSTAASYNNVGYCLNSQGKHREALPLYQKALDVRLKTLGERHSETAISYNNLSSCLDSQGKHREALPLYQKALDVRLKTLGERHPDTAASYNNAAACLDSQGKHREALPLHQKALDVWLKTLGELHPHTAISYNNVASCLNAQGKHQEALPLHQKALDVWLKTLGEQHPSTAQSYNNVAYCLSSQGKHREALPLYQKALDVRLRTLGKLHPDTAQSYINLASCLNAQGKHREALPLHQKALDVWLKTLGELHPHTAISYNNVASCLNAQGKHQEALPLYQKALDVRLKTLGEQHPSTAQSHNNVALFLIGLGKHAEALRLMQASLPGQEAARFHKAGTGFERALAASIQSPHAMLAAGLARLGQTHNAFRHAELSLARGLLDDLAGPHLFDHDRIAALSNELRSLDGQVVPLLGQETLSTQLVPLRDQLIARRRIVQAELSRLASEVSARQVLPLDAIQKQLPANAALVLWIDKLNDHLGCVLRRDGPPAWVSLPGSDKGGGWTQKDEVLPRQAYLALIADSLSADDRKDLLEEGDDKSRPFLKDALQRRNRPALLAALYRQRLAPLEPHLQGVRHLLVVPTGAMARVPVEALTDRWLVSYVPSGTAFARSAAQHRRLQGDALLVVADPTFTPTPPNYPPAPPHGLLLTAVPQGSLAARIKLTPGDVLLEYADKKLLAPADLTPADDAATVPIKLWRDGQVLSGRIPGGPLGVEVATRPVAEALAAWRLQFEQPTSTRGKPARISASLAGLTVGNLSGGTLPTIVALGCTTPYWPAWSPLPGTRLEGRALAALVPSTTMLTGSAASQQTLEQLAESGKLSSFRLLHLATHGEANSTRPLDTALILAQDRLPDARTQTARVLADKPPLDGRLTVDIIRRTWKLDADLVTLSACESGLGMPKEGEGMLGFAHALLQSGARSVVLSRWKVDDTATALLMTRFYENLLGKRADLKQPLGRAEALREAKRWLRDLPRAEAAKHAGSLRGKTASLTPTQPVALPAGDRPFAEPYYWAAFVLIGDPD